MKKIILAVILSSLFIISCGPQQKMDIDEDMFNQIWTVYLSEEFEESFYEQLPAGKRADIMQNIIVNRTKIPFLLFVQYMKIHHPEKYKLIFIGK